VSWLPQAVSNGNQLMQHLADDALPKILRMAFEIAYARGDYF
jgi:hypothetical protein